MLLEFESMLGLTRTEMMIEYTLLAGRNRRLISDTKTSFRGLFNMFLKIFGLGDCEYPQYRKIDWDAFYCKLPKIEDLKGLSTEEVIKKIELCEEQDDWPYCSLDRVEKIYLEELGLWDECKDRFPRNSWPYRLSWKFKIFPNPNDLIDLSREEVIKGVRQSINDYCKYYEIILDEVFIINSYLKELGFPKEQLLCKKPGLEEAQDYWKKLIPTMTEERTKKMAEEMMVVLDEPGQK